MVYKFRKDATTDIYVFINEAYHDYDVDYTDISSLMTATTDGAGSVYEVYGNKVKTEAWGVFAAANTTIVGRIQLSDTDIRYPFEYTPGGMGDIHAAGVLLRLEPMNVLIAPKQSPQTDFELNDHYVMEEQPVGYNPGSKGTTSQISNQIDELMIEVNKSQDWTVIKKTCSLELGYANITFDISGARESSEGIYDWSFSIQNININMKTIDSDVNKYLNSYQLSFDALFSQSKTRNRLRMTYGYGIGEIGMMMYKSVRVSTSGGLDSGDSLTAEFTYPYTAQYLLNGKKIHTAVISVDGPVMNIPPIDIHAARLIMNRN